MYDGKIKASDGRGKDAKSVTLNDPCYKPNMTLADWIKVYGESIVLSHFLASRKIAIQKPMQIALKEGKEDKDVLAAGSAKAKDLTAVTRTTKSQRKTRTEVEATFKAQGFDVNDAKVKAIIDGMFATK